MIRRLLVAVAVPAAVVLATGAPAWAHNQLAGSDPAAGATLPAAPRTVTLRFTQQLSPDFTTIAVSDAARRRVPTSAPAISSGTGAVTIDGAMNNGVYTVAFRTVSVDGHTVQGSYTFTVADPARPAAAPPAAIEEPAEGGGTAGPALAALGAVGAVLAALAVWSRRSVRG